MNKQKKIKLTLLSIFVLLGAQLQAQKTYTLEECIQQTLTNNMQVKNARLDEQTVN